MTTNEEWKYADQNKEEELQPTTELLNANMKHGSDVDQEITMPDEPVVEPESGTLGNVEPINGDTDGCGADDDQVDGNDQDATKADDAETDNTDTYETETDSAGTDGTGTDSVKPAEPEEPSASPRKKRKSQKQRFQEVLNKIAELEQEKAILAKKAKVADRKNWDRRYILLGKAAISQMSVMPKADARGLEEHMIELMSDRDQEWYRTNPHHTFDDHGPVTPNIAEQTEQPAG